ncbi:MAG: hypothetical protein IJX70_04110 [Clostridia bacterium]|nr:hypothetical protein [Clostridia bacterium]
MTALEIILNILSMILIALSATMIINHLYPKFKKLEKETEEEAKQYRYVEMNKTIKNAFIIMAIITNLIGIIIFIFPNLITNILGFNYTATIIVWWLPVLFDNVILYFMLTKATYNDKEIIVKKALSKSKIYKYEDIISYSESRNLRVKTKTGNFTLLNAMSGTNTLRQIIKSKSIKQIR